MHGKCIQIFLGGNCPGSLLTKSKERRTRDCNMEQIAWRLVSVSWGKGLIRVIINPASLKCIASVIVSPCWKQFAEIFYSEKADLVPNIARSAFAFWSCLGFTLIFKCPGELDIIICGWRSISLSLTAPSFLINVSVELRVSWWRDRRREEAGRMPLAGT